MDKKEREAYIASHIDEAIARGWVTLYFQPVIRTMSGKICSGEALARWIDPKLGMISPGEFVPVLEEHDLSYKLSQFVIDEAAGLISSAEKMGMYPIPLSINLSRKDFELMDPFVEAEKAVRKYGISRNLLCIEITESTAMENPELIRKYIDQFHEAGYEVWMDDFGSAYSSLNVLKDFDFDEIKLDMVFLQHFNDKARKIIAHCIDMARDLGMQTVCEGVETEEQAAFLRDHGCGKIQGFYYSRPLPLPELKAEIDGGKFSYELSVERFLYDKACATKFDPETPGAVVLHKNDLLYPLQITRPLREQIREDGMDPAVLREPLHLEDTDFRQKLDTVIRNAEESGSEEEVSYFLNGHYFVLTARVVSTSMAGSICAIDIRDITKSARGLVLKDAGPVAQSILSLYDCIYRTDLENKKIEVVLSDFSGEMAGKSFSYDPESMSVFIYWKDRERFREWIDPDYMEDALWEQHRRSVSDLFRIERTDGTRVWELFTMVREEGKGPHEAILCLKPALYSDAGMNRRTENLYMNGAWGAETEPDAEQRPALPGDLNFTAEAGWNALMEQNAMKIFWKDREHRFAGASKSFLDYFGVSDVSEIIGKTDADCRWHIDDHASDLAEQEVLESGQILSDLPGKVIVNGEVRRVITSRFPLYRDGEIIGLTGVFIDAEELRGCSTENDGGPSAKTDPHTGAMNFSAWLGELAGYEDNYSRKDEDYWIGVLVLQNYWKISHEFGTKTAEDMSKIAADTIRAELPGTCVIGRADQGTFVIVTRDPDADLSQRLKKVAAILSGDHYIDVYRGAISSYCAVSSRSETSNPFRAVGLALEMAEKAQTRESSRNERSTHGTGPAAPREEKILTKEQIREEMDVLLEVFDFVRLSDPDRQKVIRFDRDGIEREEHGNCFDIWGTGFPCDNCISSRTLHTKEGLTKFETDGTNVFIVASRYVNIEGRACVLEMVLRMNDTNSLGADERGVFLRSLSNCRARIYEDSMTGIHNRRYYDDLMADNEAEAAAVIDIDGMTKINHTYGHIAGDAVIRAVAREIVARVPYRDLVHYDGDRFLIEFEEKESEGLEEGLRKILGRIRKLRFERYPGLQVTASACGITHPGRVRDLLLEADGILTNAERDGSGTCIID